MVVFAAQVPVIESSGDSNVDGTSGNMGDDVSLLHSFANWSMPASGLNAHNPSTTQFTIFYNGNICVYEGIPAEKVREIMLIAGASAKSAEVKKGTPFTSFIPTDPSSPDGNSNNLTSQQSVCFPAEKNPICRLQEFPIARRQSLQRFLEKRRDRLGSKDPYASSTIKAADENNFCADNNAPNEGYQSTVAAS
ncbi:unnamed protein product [Lupinus luteus]|uniref:Protein TIFY n=1 Tax=Lupinus luteus TaxID=3873 RepID=A0AAV1Y8E7_LUPLU